MAASPIASSDSTCSRLTHTRRLERRSPGRSAPQQAPRAEPGIRDGGVDTNVGSARVLLLDLYDAAIAAAAPAPLTAAAIDALKIPRERRVWIFSFGKAAQPMAAAAVQSLLRSLHQIVGGVVVSPELAPAPYPTMVSLRGDHPVPGKHSFAAAKKIEQIAAGRHGADVAIVLISGGASSLIAGPLRDMSEHDLARTYELLLGSGLDIRQMNAVRKRFSRWGAGRLALALAPAATHCFAISDVVGDDCAVIGSGPCAPDPLSVLDVHKLLRTSGLYAALPAAHREYLENVARGTAPETPRATHPAFAHVATQVIANNAMALAGAAARARDRGLDAEISRHPLRGEAAAAAEVVSRELVMAGNELPGLFSRVLIWGGETTVTLDPRAGTTASGGGRCQELALAAAHTLYEAGPRATRTTLLAAGTDGRDGATDAAGAVVDAATWSAMLATGHDPAVALATHGSNAALAAVSATIPRRTTGTNVADIVIGLAG